MATRFDTATFLWGSSVMIKISSTRKIFSNFIRNPDLYLAAAAFVFVSCVTFLLVLTRYVYSLSLPALEEITMVVFVWFLYLSMVYCTRNDHHIKVDIIDRIVSDRWAKILDFFADLTLIIFTSVMFFYALLLVDFNFDNAGGKTPMLDLPYYAIYLVLPLSFAFFTILLAIKIARRARGLFAKR